MEWIYDFLSNKNIIRLKNFYIIFKFDIFFNIIYFGFLMVEEAFTKNYSTEQSGTHPFDTILIDDDRSYTNDTSIYS